MTIALDGRLDSGNAKQVEGEIGKLVSVHPKAPVVLDCENLGLVSSAGLRTILRLKQSVSHIRLVNVNPTVFDILQTTGFTELMEVQRAYRVITVKGCEKIGQGANGVVYRYDEDTIVKTFKELPHNTAAHLAVPFPISAACRFLDLPPVNLRNLQLHLSKNSLAS